MTEPKDQPSDSPAGEEGLSPWAWGCGLVAIVGVLWYLFGR